MAEKYVTQGDYKETPAYTPADLVGMTEQAGYRSIKSQVMEIMAAGIQLQNYNKIAYPAGAQDAILPVFMDRLDALELRKQARAVLDEAAEADNKVLRDLAEKERLQQEKDAADLKAYREKEAKQPPNGEPPKT